MDGETIPTAKYRATGIDNIICLMIRRKYAEALDDSQSSFQYMQWKRINKRIEIVTFYTNTEH